MSGVETVFLDAGGVLVDPDWPRVSRVLASRGIDVPAAALAAAEPAAKREIDVPATVARTDDRGRGGLFFPAVLARAVPGIPPGLAGRACEALLEAHAAENLWSVVPAGVPGALDRLRAAGLRLAVVSNADGSLAALFGRLGLAGRFDVLVDSGVLGIEKPDPRIFEHALRACGARREGTVHAGDFYAIDVEGARGAGIGAVLIDPAGVHADRDCERWPSLPAWADHLLATR